MQKIFYKNIKKTKQKKSDTDIQYAPAVAGDGGP